MAEKLTFSLTTYAEKVCCIRCNRKIPAGESVALVDDYGYLQGHKACIKLHVAELNASRKPLPLIATRGGKAGPAANGRVIRSTKGLS